MKKLQIAVIILSFGFIGFRIIDPPKHSTENTELIQCTQLNGDGCVCHTIDESPLVLTWVEGPHDLLAGETALYKVYVSGGPALGGGFNVAARYGELAAVDSTVKYLDHELTQMYPRPFPQGATSIYWEFSYTAPTDKRQDTIYSCGLSTNHDLKPNAYDLWSYGPKFVVDIRHSPTSVDETQQIATDFKLIGNYPNPFNPSTTVKFSLPSATEVEMLVYTVAGDLVSRVSPTYLPAGENSFSFNAGSLPSGVYFYRIIAGEAFLTGKMILSK